MLAFHLGGMLAAAAAPAGPVPAPVEVFTQNESPYFCVKIPELLQLEGSGVLLAFGEARMFSCGDYTTRLCTRPSRFSAIATDRAAGVGDAALEPELETKPELGLEKDFAPRTRDVGGRGRGGGCRAPQW